MKGNSMAKRKQLPKYTDFLPGTTVKEIMGWLRGDDVRSKTDLRDWTGSPPFHLNREPVDGHEKASHKKETPSG